MKVIKRFNQVRRDLDIEVQCEDCNHIETIHGAYDDRNYWDNVVPAMKCPNCKKSSNDLGSEKQDIPTRYPEGYQV